MPRITATYLPWITLLTAVALWAGAGYFLWIISSEESMRTSHVVDLEQESIQQAATLRLHSLARETKDARAQLERIAHTEIVKILDSVEAVGHDAGIALKLGQALSDPSPNSSSPVRLFSLVIEAEGSFLEVTHAAALLESLPNPSVLNELQFERLPQSTAGSGKRSGGLWHMVAHMRFLTTADISS